jgi:endonuclease-3
MKKADFTPPTKTTIRRAHELLQEHYGSRKVSKRDPLDGLVLIILSQATNDINCDRAFTALKKTFPTWNAVMNAPVEAVAGSIRCGGLANQKAARIQQLLREMKEDQGELDLSWMHGASAAECEEYLSKFHGVGPKTIACVLVFFLDKPAFPVDTHVHRVTKRLGWIRPQAGPEEAHKILGAIVPDDYKLDLHVNLISHGRFVCRADGNGGPKCGECFLKKLCAYGKSVKTPKDAPPAKPINRKDFFVTVE